MARSPNCTGAPLYKGRVDVSISYPDPDETLLETPVALPTSEPAEAQISYTLGSQHMPVWSPFELEHVKVALLYASGKNTAGANRLIYYRVLKNGTSVATGSRSTAAGAYYSWSHYRFPSVALSDVVACKLWANESGCNWDYKSIAVVPTRIGPADIVVTDILILASNPYPTLSGGFKGRSISLPHLQHEDIQWAHETGSIRHHVMFPKTQYRLMRVGSGDVSLSSYPSDGTEDRGYYYANQMPTRISYTPLNLRV